MVEYWFFSQKNITPKDPKTQSPLFQDSIPSSLELQKLSELIGLINAAGRDPEQWQTAIDAVTLTIPGVTGHMQGYDTYSKTMPAQVTSNMSEQALKPFIERVPEINLWWEKMAHLPIGKALSTDHYVPLPTIKNSEFYAEWLQPNKIASCVGCFLFKDDSRMAALGFHYDQKYAETMTPQVMELISLLAPHFQQALQMNRERLTTLTNAENLVERIQKPAFILRQDCHIIYMNRAAETCLKIHRGISLNSYGQLSLVDPDQDRAFRKMVFTTVHKDSLTELENNGILQFAIDNAPKNNPNTLFVTPLLNGGHSQSNPLAALLGDCERQAMVTISYKQDQIQRIETTVSHLFADLTAKEVSLTTALCQGFSLKDYAALTKVEVSTLRTQLSRGVFPKTGIHSQNQLVAFVLKHNNLHSF